MVPSVSLDAYRAARQRAAIVDRSDRGRLVVSGVDRATYLQGLLTHDIAGLTAGQGHYAAYLTAQGRMIADLFVYELGDVILLTMIGAVKDTVLGKLAQFIFTEDVTLGDVTDTFAQTAVIGPLAAATVSAVMSGVSEAVLSALPEHGNVRALFGGTPAIVTHVTDTGEPGFDVFVDGVQAHALRAALRQEGAVTMDADTAETIRIEAGVPLFHKDMDEETIPLEAGIESRAISFTKGCYVGQEVIIRIVHRGHGRVARRLVGLVMDGPLPPAPGAVASIGDRAIGVVTSSAQSPALDHPIALAYLQRDFMAAETVVVVDGISATVTPLPFVSPQV
jgi:folate-binding protein YgfZ